MKIAIKLAKNSLYFSKYKKEIDKDILNNTNVINTKNLIFNIEYIKENKDLVTAFLKVITIKNNISKIIIKQMDIADICINLINGIDNITDVTISENEKLSFNAFTELEKSTNVKYLCCSSIMSFMFDRLSLHKNIKIETKLETIYINKFMIDNNLDKYSKIYYKKSLIFNNINENDLDYINMVIEISNSLKVLKFTNFNYETLIEILNICVNKNKTNLKIILKIDNQNRNYFDKHFKKIKKLSKILKQKYNYKLKILYSTEYIKENYLKQINLNIFKLLLIIIIFIIVLIIYIYNINNHKAKKNIKNISNIVDEIKVEENQSTEDTIKKEVKIDYNTAYYKSYSKVFTELLKINNETIGWLTVNNTTIDYPIVQHSDNDFYLTKDFYKVPNTNGWLFMDYRNNINNLDDNTIIYGHETDTQIMFGDLKKVLNKSWYTNKGNQTISFTTLNSNLNFQVFSIYTINDTDDYLYNKFYNNNEKIDFYNKIKDRSIYNFNVTLNTEDKILTLSTCYKSDKKLVVHAKLIK